MTIKGNKHVVSITLSPAAFERLNTLAVGSSRSAVVEAWLVDLKLDGNGDPRLMDGRDGIVKQVRRRLKTPIGSSGTDDPSGSGKRSVMSGTDS